MAEHLELQIGDILRFPQTNDLFPDLLAGDCIYRRVIGYQDGKYLTQGFMPSGWDRDGYHEGYEVPWDRVTLEQAFIDRFASKLMSGPEEA